MAEQTPAAPAAPETTAQPPAAPEAPAAAKPEEGASPQPGQAAAPEKAPELSASEAAKRLAAERKRYKVKVDGEEAEVDEDELLRGYQTTRAAMKRMEEVAQLRGQLESFVKDFQTDPVSTLKKLAAIPGEKGAQFRDAVEKFLYEELQKEKMTPEQRELAEAKEKLRAAEEQRKAVEESQRQAKLQAAQAHWAKKYDEEITAALQDPNIGLPKTPATVRRMAELMGKSLRAGLDIPATDVARLVREEYLEAQREVVSNLDGEQLVRYLGEDVAKKIRAYDVARLKAKPAPGAPAPAPAKPAAQPAQPQTKRMSEREFDEWVKGVARG